jgi:hypothetical protein
MKAAAHTPPGGDWQGTDADGYTSAKLKARVMCLGQGTEWWAQMDGEWLAGEDGAMAFPTARMACEQVEMRRKSQETHP